MRKRLYPSKIKVGKSTYRVKLVPHIEEINGNVTRGYCESEEKLITLLSTQNEKDLFSTFIHELLHAIEAEHKVKLKHSLVYALETPVAEALLRNFHLLPRR